MRILKRLRSVTASAAKRTAGLATGAWQHERYDKTREYKEARKAEERSGGAKHGRRA